MHECIETGTISTENMINTKRMCGTLLRSNQNKGNGLKKLKGVTNIGMDETGLLISAEHAKL